MLPVVITFTFPALLSDYFPLAHELHKHLIRIITFVFSYVGL